MTSPVIRPRSGRETRAPRSGLLAVAAEAPRVAPEEFLRRASRSFREIGPVGHLWSPSGGMQSAGWGVARRFEVAGDAPSPGFPGGNGDGDHRMQAGGVALDQVAALASGLFRELAGADEVPLRLFGGLAFDPGPDSPGSGASDWDEFGAGSFVLPRLGYVADGDAAHLYAVIDATAVGAAPEWQRRLQRLAEDLDLTGSLGSGANGNGHLGELPEAANTLEALPGILRSLDRPAASEWLQRVKELRAEVLSERLQKVVAARAVELDLDRPFGIDDLVRIAGRLGNSMPTCTRFAFLRGGSIFFGATPELLVRRRGRRIETQALAGSIASDPKPVRRRELERRLLESRKDRLEHDVVVRYLVERLDRSCGGVSPPAPPEVRVLPNVMHLETPIRAALPETVEPPHVLRLVRALHPTPAVAGRPTPLALAAIRRTEERARGWYAGPVGWFDGSGDGEFSVALRSCLATRRRGLLYSGNGIVADSDPARELVETNLKLDAILGAWG
ncbi:MAG: isochorismate synthase [Acidobacteriota bacterium]|nr:isochorismate synthase [Acidobacteriota bacterium]